MIAYNKGILMHTFFNSSKKSCSEGDSSCWKDNLSRKGGIESWLSWRTYGSSTIEMPVFLGLSLSISSITSRVSLERTFPDLKCILFTEDIE